jgi:hypothetical protein
MKRHSTEKINSKVNFWRWNRKKTRHLEYFRRTEISLHSSRRVWSYQIDNQKRQHNCQKKEDKGTNNDLIKHTHNTKDRVKRTSLNSVINDKHKYYLLNDENTFVTEISEDQKQTCKGEMTRGECLKASRKHEIYDILGIPTNC